PRPCVAFVFQTNNPTVAPPVTGAMVAKLAILTLGTKRPLLVLVTSKIDPPAGVVVPIPTCAVPLKENNKMVINKIWNLLRKSFFFIFFYFNFLIAYY